VKPEIKIESLAIATLIEDPNNARRHNAKNIMAIKGSLAKFGQQKPIVVNRDNVVIAGNGTLEAARELGWSTIVVARSDLKGFDAAAFALADNRTSELATWDNSVLNATLRALEEMQFDLPAIGFDIKDFGEKDETDTKDLPNKKYEILVSVNNEHEQKDLFDEFTERSLKCVIL